MSNNDELFFNLFSSVKWSLIKDKPYSPYLNHALEEAMLNNMILNKVGATIRIWDWTKPAIIIGRFQSVSNEVNVEMCEHLNIDIVRRITGGGAMFIEPLGAITYSLYVSESLIKDFTSYESYEFFDHWVLKALNSIGIDAFYKPINDITSKNGKIGGAAQTRKSEYVLHHSTLAYSMNIDIMKRVLRISAEKIKDKGIQSASKRVSPLSLETSLSRESIISILINYLTTNYNVVDDYLPDFILNDALRLVDEKYKNKNWIYDVK